MDAVPTLFFSAYCPFCAQVMDELGPLMNRENQPLIARFPTPQERKQVNQLPALYLPEGTFGLDSPHLLVGGQIPDWIADLVEEN